MPSGPAAAQPQPLAQPEAVPPATGRVGRGRAFGAVTILNATATGVGCSLAVEAGATATWRWRRGPFEAATPGADGALAHAVWTLMRDMVADDAVGASTPQPPGPGGPEKAAQDGLSPMGAVVETASPFPPSRGLKTSSSVAGALVRAALDALPGGSPETPESSDAAGAADPSGASPDWVADRAVAASRAAGVTLTGAHDDQTAVLRGGAHVTDNTAGRILRSFHVPAWHVAVWVPEASVRKASLAGFDAAVLVPRLAPALRILREGDAAGLPDVMTANGRAFHAFYKAAGLPVDDRPAKVALEAGALGAGLSGTGPAVAALFVKRVELAAVPGGRWAWTKAVEGPR